MSSDGSASEPGGQPVSSEQALRSWLEATLTEHKIGLSESEWHVLREVAAGCLSESSAMGECVEQLVEAFLNLRFPAIREDDGTRQRMSARIAQTLCSDPTARQRLVEFRQILQQSKS